MPSPQNCINCEEVHVQNQWRIEPHGNLQPTTLIAPDSENPFNCSHYYMTLLFLDHKKQRSYDSILPSKNAFHT